MGQQASCEMMRATNVIVGSDGDATDDEDGGGNNEARKYPIRNT